MAVVPKVGTSAGNSSSGTTSLTTPAQAVASGATMYVQVAMYFNGASLAAPNITDSQGGAYPSALESGSVQIGTTGNYVYLWIFKRVGPLFASPSFTVTVTPGSSSAQIEVVAIEIIGDGGVDAISLFNSATASSNESSSVTTTGSNELVLFLGADYHVTTSIFGLGQNLIANYPTPPSNVRAYGTYQAQQSPGAASSQLGATPATTWAAVSVAISPQLVPWADLGGKPALTVSAVGILGGGSTIPNAGADFGVDTPNTTTGGLNEAISAIAAMGGGTVRALPGTFALSNYITTASANNLRLILDPGAVIQIPASPTWSIHTASNPTRVPAIVIRQATNVRVCGGLITSLAPYTFDTMGVLIGDGCADVHLTDMEIANMTRFGVLINGYAGSAGSATDVHVDSCVISSCGVIGNMVNDGGGVRLENPTTNAVGPVWVCRNTIKPTNFFGIDVGGSNASTSSVTDVHITDNIIAGPASYAGGIGINVEGQTVAAGSLLTADISGNDISAMTGPGIQVAGGAEFIVIRGNLVQGCKAEGINISTGASTVLGVPQEIAIIGNVVKNNNQSSQGAAGIGITAGGSASNLQYVLVSGNFCWDDRTSGPTQTVGIKVNAGTVTFQYLQIFGNLCPPVTAVATISIVNAGTLSGVFVKYNLGFNPQPKSAFSLATSPFTTTVRHYASDVYVQDAASPNSAGISGIRLVASPTRGGGSLDLTIPSPFVPLFVHLEPEDTLRVTWTSATYTPIVTEVPQ
jgi:hypothetical protein